MNTPLIEFLSGAIACGFAVIALFFLKFWRKSADRLFLFFALAFGVMTIERVLIALGDFDAEIQPFIYMIRLGGFILIILGIVEKNRKG